MSSAQRQTRRTSSRLADELDGSPPAKKQKLEKTASRGKTTQSNARSVANNRSNNRGMGISTAWSECGIIRVLIATHTEEVVGMMTDLMQSTIKLRRTSTFGKRRKRPLSRSEVLFQSLTLQASSATHRIKLQIESNRQNHRTGQIQQYLRLNLYADRSDSRVRQSMRGHKKFGTVQRPMIAGGKEKDLQILASKGVPRSHSKARENCGLTRSGERRRLLYRFKIHRSSSEIKI